MKFLVVGLGSMGKRRIRNLKRHGVNDIIGVDLASERRDEVVGLHGIKVFESFEQAMKENPVAVIVSTPPDKHMGFAKSAVAAGKHVFTEASTTPAGMAEVSSIAKANGVVAAASCTMRHHPSIKRMQEIVAGGGIGSILSYTHHAGQWLPDWHPNEDYRKFYVSKRETGACREIVPFELTWLNWIVDAKIERVAAMKAKLSSLDCDIDDIYHLLIQYEGGTIGHLQIDVLDRAGVRRCRIVGSEGSLDWSLSDRTVRHYSAATKEWTSFTEPPPRVEKGYSEMSNEAMYDSEILSFLEAIRGKEPWGNPLTDEIAVLEVLGAAERAAETGNTQVLA